MLSFLTQLTKFWKCQFISKQGKLQRFSLRFYLKISTCKHDVQITSFWTVGKKKTFFHKYIYWVIYQFIKPYSIWYSYFKCKNVLRFRYFIQPPNFVTQFNQTAQPFPWPSFSPQNVVLSFCYCNQISATSPIKFKTPVWWNVQYTLVCTKT